jgi:hypothetical protein
MNKRTLSMILCVAAALSVGTAAFAQEGQHKGRKSGGDVSAVTETGKGNASSIPQGQGGTAGAHPTGANVGPGRAGQVKDTGE